MTCSPMGHRQQVWGLHPARVMLRLWAIFAHVIVGWFCSMQSGLSLWTSLRLMLEVFLFENITTVFGFSRHLTVALLFVIRPVTAP